MAGQPASDAPSRRGGGEGEGRRAGLGNARPARVCREPSRSGRAKSMSRARSSSGRSSWYASAARSRSKAGPSIGAPTSRSSRATGTSRSPQRSAASRSPRRPVVRTHAPLPRCVSASRCFSTDRRTKRWGPWSIRSRSRDVRRVLKSRRACSRGLRSRAGVVLLESAALAYLAGDAITRQRALREAHRVFTAIGATGHAERLASQLGA